MSLVVRDLATGVGRGEGPLIRADGEIVFVSMDQGRIYKIKDGKTDVLCEIGHKPNGATEGLDGRVYVTQVGEPRWAVPNPGIGGVQIVERDGSVSWLTKDPVTPNDLCFGPDAFLYVTDPTRFRRDDGRLFRVDPKTGEAELLCSVPWFPNGIGIGLDNALYVAKSAELQIIRFSLDGGKLGKPELYVQMPSTHRPDGFAFDVEGNILIGANSNGDDPAHIQTYNLNGKLIDTFIPGTNKSNTNVALSADRFLVITATDVGKVWGVENWPHAGLPLYPFRKS